jgi:hypothetical protein
MKLIYSNFGRIVHGFIGVLGPRVMDDFGNSVPTTNKQVMVYMRQGFYWF